MGATIVKIKPQNSSLGKKPLSPLQQKLLAGPVMSLDEYQEFKKINKWMGKWKT